MLNRAIPLLILAILLVPARLLGQADLWNDIGAYSARFGLWIKQNGDPQLAVPCLVTCARLSPLLQNWCLAEVARVKADLGKLEEAIALAKSLPLQSPARFSLLSSLAGWQSSLGQEAQAAATRDERHQTLLAGPDQSLLALAEDFIDQGGARSGIWLLGYLLRRAPVGSEIWCRATLKSALGQAKIGERQRALDDNLRVIRLCSMPLHRTEAHWQRALILLPQKGPAAAQAELKEVQDLPPTERHRDALGLLKVLQSSAKADRAFTQALTRQLKTNPGRDDRTELLWTMLWDAYSRQRYTDAIAYGHLAINTLPEEQSYYLRGRARYWTAEALLKDGQRSRAMALHRRNLATSPLSFYGLLSASRLGEGAQEQMIDAATRSVGYLSPRLPDQPDTPVWRKASLLVRAGLHRAAVEELRLMGVVRPDSASGQVALCHLLETHGAQTLAHGIAKRSLAERDHGQWARGGWLPMLWFSFPDYFSDMIAHSAKRNRLDPWLIQAVVREESAYLVTAESYAQAVGLMQLLVPTANDMVPPDRPLTKRDLHNPSLNVMLGGRYLRKMMDTFGHEAVALAAYNAGPGRARSWLRTFKGNRLDEFLEWLPIPGTARYAKKVLSSYAHYCFLYQLRIPDLTTDFLKLRPGT